MLLPERSIAVSVAVLGFFGTCTVGLLSDVSPETCSTRGLIAAAGGYVAGLAGAKALNAILTSAVISHWVEEQKDQASAHE